MCENAEFCNERMLFEPVLVYLYMILSLVQQKELNLLQLLYVTAPGISEADYFSVASITVTGVQIDIYTNAWRFSCYLKKYKVMIFKRMSKL
jgi:hypothetical protein